jgi:hypothetical protein
MGVFRNVGTNNSDAGESPERKHTPFTPLREYEIKKVTVVVWRKLRNEELWNFYFSSATLIYVHQAVTVHSVTAWCTVLLEGLIAVYPFSNCPHSYATRRLPSSEGSSLDPLFSRINADHVFSSYLFMTHFSIILSSRRRSSYVIFSSGCFDQDLTLNSHLSHLCFTLLHPHLPWSDHPTGFWRRIQNINLFQWAVSSSHLSLSPS